MKNIDHHHARRFEYVYKFQDGMITMNGNEGFANSFKEIYPEELELKNANDNVATFLDLNITIKEGRFN